MVEITLIELNIDEPSFTAGNPFGGSSSSSSSSDDGGGLSIGTTDEGERSSEEGGRSLKAPILGFFLLVGGAVLARRLLDHREREKVTA